MVAGWRRSGHTIAPSGSDGKRLYLLSHSGSATRSVATATIRTRILRTLLNHGWKHFQTRIGCSNPTSVPTSARLSDACPRQTFANFLRRPSPSGVREAPGSVAAASSRRWSREREVGREHAQLTDGATDGEDCRSRNEVGRRCAGSENGGADHGRRESRCGGDGAGERGHDCGTLR
jgi:hypothetical protein